MVIMTFWLLNMSDVDVNGNFREKRQAVIVEKRLKGLQLILSQFLYGNIILSPNISYNNIKYNSY